MKIGPFGCDITTEICTTDYPHEIKVRYKVVDGWPMIFFHFKIDNESHYFTFYADELDAMSVKMKKITDNIMYDLSEIVREKFNQNKDKDKDGEEIH